MHTRAGDWSARCRPGYVPAPFQRQALPCGNESGCSSFCCAERSSSTDFEFTDRPARLEFDSEGRTGLGMNTYGRQTAPPRSEVVSVTFRVWVHEFEARPRGIDVFCDSSHLNSHGMRVLGARNEVYSHFATEVEPAGSASRIQSVFPVGSA